jgi:hypothetical protein
MTEELRIVLEGDLPSCRIEDAYSPDTAAVRQEFERGCDHSQAIAHTPSEVDGGCLFEVTSRTRYLSDAKAEHDRLAII